jgi:hypothetical protein
MSLQDFRCYKEQTVALNTIVTTPELESAINELIKTSVDPEKQTIVHCRLRTEFFTYIRIHPTTYLIENTGKKCKLITTIDITVAPEWCAGNYQRGYNYFTLIFEGLSYECSSFHLQEFAGPVEGNLFETKMMERNKTDVYEVQIILSN